MKSLKMYNRHYFITDGAYGDARGLYLLNTQHFTEQDWQDIDDCPDRTRTALAQAIYKQRAEENESFDSMYEDVPEYLKLAISHVVSAMKTDDQTDKANHLVEARIALNSVVEGLSLGEQLNCDHNEMRIRSGVNHSKFFECVYCGAIGVQQKEDKWNSGS